MPAEYMFKDVPKWTRSSTTRSRCSSPSTTHGIRRRSSDIDENEHAKRACASTPTGSSPASNVDPNRAWRRSARSTRYADGVRPQVACARSRAGLIPAGRDQRQEDVPDLRQVRGARRPDLRRPWACPARASRSRRRTSRMLDEVCWFFPELQVRHAPRLRAVDRARGEADAQVAEPLLLDHRVRAEALPQGHHQLREHARRRQDHLVRATSPPGLSSTGSSPSCPTSRSATTCGRSSSTRTRHAASSSSTERPERTCGARVEPDR